MSATIAGGGPRISKGTCSKCRRTIHIAHVEGERFELDPEIMSAVVAPEGGGRTARVLVRRIHGELCERYKLEAEKLKARTAMRAAARTGRRRPI